MSNADRAESGTGGPRASLVSNHRQLDRLAWRHSGNRAGVLDGAPVTDVDLFAPSEGPQDTVFTATGLANATHTLTIEATGLKNALGQSLGVVDAFDVRP